MCFEDFTVIRGRLRGRLTALAAVIAVAPGVAACGDGSSQAPAPAETGTTESGTDTATAAADEPAADPADDEAKIIETLEVVLAGGDPASACGESVTDRFVRRSYGDADGCEAAQKAAKPAHDVGVTEVVINPESVAQARARPRGGIYDGQELRAELVLDEAIWKLDSLRSNVPVGP